MKHVINHSTDEKQNIKADTSFLGRFWLQLDNFYNKKNIKKFKANQEYKKIKMVWVKPIWYPLIYDRKSQVDGKLLMGYVLMD